VKKGSAVIFFASKRFQAELKAEEDCVVPFKKMFLGLLFS